jgi:hypothetical protein
MMRGVKSFKNLSEPPAINIKMSAPGQQNQDEHQSHSDKIMLRCLMFHRPDVNRFGTMRLQQRGVNQKGVCHSSIRQYNLLELKPESGIDRKRVQAVCQKKEVITDGING